MTTPVNQICLLSELLQSQCLSFQYLASNGDIVEALVIKHNDIISAYLNSCPHQQVQLSWGQDDWYNAAGDHLFCIFHGALFQIHDGLCVPRSLFGPQFASNINRSE